MAPGTEKADGVEDQRGGSMFITQRAQVAGTGADGRPVKKGQKMSKAVKLPKIDAARGVDPVTQSSQSTELVLANKEMAEVQHKLDRKKDEPKSSQKNKTKKSKEDSKQPFKGERFPSFLKLRAKNDGEKEVAKIPLGGEKTIFFDTDVEDHYS